MPKPSLRTRSKKRLGLRLPGGRTGTRYGREKVGRLHCPRCGKKLSGVPSVVSSQMRSHSASKRRVERPYGGLLCHVCLRELLKRSVRSS